jgi:glucosylceramidase
VTVNDTSTAQSWEGFGGCFNEMGWSQLSTQDLKTEAINLLFGTDGAHFTMGRIPIGASDYATNRYTLDDPASDNDPVATSSGSNRPAADTSMSNFKIDRDKEKLIPYVQTALAVNPNLRLWASPWTPPPWMKTGYKTSSGGDGTLRASYYDGGNMKSGDSATLTAYADYYTKWVKAYKDNNINIEMVSPQNEPGYEQNYPSCLWDKATYVNWIKTLGPAMSSIGVKVMLGTLSNNGDNSRTDLDISSAVLADSTAKGIVSVVGVQWGVLDAVNSGQTFSGLPIWATEHKCGNYPWNPSGYPKYAATAPNDQAYAVESWGYIRDAINKGGVTAYNAWNMVLDNVGKGNDTSRDWAQDSLLTVSGGKITKTQAYYVFRHFSQFVDPGATVLKTSGSTESVAFKNSDGSLVAVVYSSAAKSNYMVAIGGKKLQFSIPAGGWATVKYKP